MPKDHTRWRTPLGKTGIAVPGIIYGTSYLGNLYREFTFQEKVELMRQWFIHTGTPLVIDTAGKYGAGLALEVIGEGLHQLGVAPEDVVISNKLGWYRVPLVSGEPVFEPGVWAGITHDCEQRYGYGEMISCFEQGNQLLGGRYLPDLVSLHDPDEFLNGSGSPGQREMRIHAVRDSYRALFDLKREGKVRAVGIGAKDWRVIRELSGMIPFDWVMLANSFTILSHPPELTAFMEELAAAGVGIVNSALFHGGFLTGGSHFDYRQVESGTPAGDRLLNWRKSYHGICKKHGLEPWEPALQFGRSHPSIGAVALNTSQPDQVRRNVEAFHEKIPASFWSEMKAIGLIDPAYSYL